MPGSALLTSTASTIAPNWIAGTISRYSNEFLMLMKNTGSSSRSSKFASPTHLGGVRKSYSVNARKLPHSTGQNAKSPSSSSAGARKSHGDSACRKRAREARLPKALAA